MRAIAIAIAIMFVPALVYYLCIRINCRYPKFTNGYVGLGSDMRAQRNNRTGVVTYTMDGATWHRAEYLTDTFRKHKKFDSL